MLNCPSAPAVARPISVPSAVLMLTTEPASARPVTMVPVSLIVTPSGLAGAVLSGALTSTPALAFPAASVAVTSTTCPLVCAGLMLTLKLPDASAVARPSSLPFSVLTVTIAPGSVRPVTVLPRSLIVKLLGAFGAVVSGGVTVPPPGGCVAPLPESEPESLLLNNATRPPTPTAPNNQAKAPELMPLVSNKG